MIQSRKVAQWGGAAFMLGNLFFLVNKLNEMSRLFLSRSMEDVISGRDVLPIIIGQIAMIVGFVAYLWVYAPRAGRFGKNALRLFCGGGILLALGHVSFMPVAQTPGESYLFLLVILGLAVMLAGLILFGIVNLRRPILGRWQWLPLVTGLMGFVGFILFSGEEITATFLVFRTLFALGLLGLGLTLWLENPVRPDVE
ncbi:MAG: hypothetical protein MUO35_05610 [Anaerolineales bacterium]|nr:hypothetical protein [Anaerolineales bacterium]